MPKGVASFAETGAKHHSPPRALALVNQFAPLLHTISRR
jgi:hypothetical protein